MPWTEVTPMDRRLQFVAEAKRTDETFVALCARFGVAPKTGYKWLARYAAEGPAALHEWLRREFGLVSAWHTEGAPEPAAHYHQWRADLAFHIDYCFAPAAWAAGALAAGVPDWPARVRAARPSIVSRLDGAARPQLATGLGALGVKKTSAKDHGG